MNKVILLAVLIAILQEHTVHQSLFLLDVLYYPLKVLINGLMLNQLLRLVIFVMVGMKIELIVSIHHKYSFKQFVLITIHFNGTGKEILMIKIIQLYLVQMVIL